MSARKTAPRLQLECSAVAKLRYLVVFVFVLSLLCIGILPVPLSLKALLLSVIAALYSHVRFGRCELSGMAVTLIWDAESRWWWLQQDIETELQLCADSYLSASMAILNFRHPVSGRRRSMVVFPSSVGAAGYRRLSVRLTLEGRQGVDDQEGRAGELVAKSTQRNGQGQ